MNQAATEATGLKSNRMKSDKFSQWAVTLLVVCIALTTQAADKKPNILYIVADDLGWKDVA